MTLLGHLRTRARHIIGPVMAATVLAYFVYHAVQGDRGLLAWIKLGQQVEDARIEHARIAAKRTDLETRVHLLQPGSLDRDLLEERVRVMLGYVHRDDMVIRPFGGRRGAIAPIMDEPQVAAPVLPRRAWAAEASAIVRISLPQR